ncbi:MAG: hypothetical protein HY530_07410 [Chloroflexi bacterium]|nr:hypothetical protein [Chloroflexota bacterium]
MTDEELQRTIQGLSGDIDQLSRAGKPLSKDEEKRRRMLALKKGILEKVKEARQKGDMGQEFTNLAAYGALTSVGEKHPFLANLIRSKFRIPI